MQLLCMSAHAAPAAVRVEDAVVKASPIGYDAWGGHCACCFCDPLQQVDVPWTLTTLDQDWTLA
jgi:hypothetical protein